MNFQKLAKIENPDTYLDIAFRAARTRNKPKIVNRKEKLKVIKTYEFENVKTAGEALSKCLRRITTSFPDLETLPEFYIELIKTTLEYPDLKKSLGAVAWADKRISSLQRDYALRIKKSVLLQKVIELRKQFYGRVSSVMKQIKKELLYIEKARGVLRRFPDLKPDLYTIAIAGYPNVGKSSLLRALTTAKPEVRDYAFTTKSLNLGYFTIDGEKVQVIDTPGAFDREIRDMNPIEKQAYLAIRHAAHLVIFLIDPTGSSGYSVKEQKNLLFRIKALNRNLISVYSKADMITERDPDRLYMSTNTKEGLIEILDLTKKHKPDR